MHECVEPFHLFRYLDEQMFRYNIRKMPTPVTDGDFDLSTLLLMSSASASPTPKLTGKTTTTDSLKPCRLFKRGRKPAKSRTFRNSQ